MDRKEPTLLGSITDFFSAQKAQKSAAEIASGAFKAFEEAEKQVVTATAELKEKAVGHATAISEHQAQLDETKDQISRLDRFQQRIKEFLA